MAERDEKRRRQDAPQGCLWPPLAAPQISPVKATGSAVGKSAEMVGLAARKSVDISVDAAADAFEGLQSAYNKSMATVFPECPVPAFMLPDRPIRRRFCLGV